MEVRSNMPAMSTGLQSTNFSSPTCKMQQPSAAAGATPGGGGGSSAVKQCAGCGGDIMDRYLLHAIDLHWHTGCLRCAVCHAPLADIGSTCFTRAGLILCRQDYIRMFGSTGCCAACGETIPPNELVLRTPFPAAVQSAGQSAASTPSGSTAVYHVHCFTCAACHCRLVAGDKYRVVNGHVICGDHDFPANALHTGSHVTSLQQQQQQQQQPMIPSYPVIASQSKQQQLIMMAAAAAGNTSGSGSKMAAGMTSASTAAPHSGGRARHKDLDNTTDTSSTPAI